MIALGFGLLTFLGSLILSLTTKEGIRFIDFIGSIVIGVFIYMVTIWITGFLPVWAVLIIGFSIWVVVATSKLLLAIGIP